MRRIYFLIKKSFYTYCKNNFFLGRRNKYSKYFHRKLFHNSKNLSNRYSSTRIENINLQKRDTKKNYIRIYFPRRDSLRRKLDRLFTIKIESVLNFLKRNAINTKIYLHY